MPQFNFHEHIIIQSASIRTALERINALAPDAILFVVDTDNKLIGSVTDGDIRRGFLNNLTLENAVKDFMHKTPVYLQKGKYTIHDVVRYRKSDFKLIPVVDAAHHITNIVNFRFLKSYLPVDAMIMAGGRGERLRPLTDEIPKPLLRVGDKPIIEHTIDSLIKYGVDDFWISLGYKAEMIKQYFGNGTSKNVSLSYVEETQPLGTVGAVRLVSDFKHDTVLLTNSDLLTNLDYEDFYLNFLETGAAASIVTIPYSVSIPYAVFQTANGAIVSLEEKPNYTYYSNAGIYLFKRELLNTIPENKFYNATDFVESLIAANHKIVSYILRGYWLDIGKPEDFRKAQDDIKFIDL
jgi:dTDP-glucose pyrophosphorylase